MRLQPAGLEPTSNQSATKIHVMPDSVSVPVSPLTCRWHRPNSRRIPAGAAVPSGVPGSGRMHSPPSAAARPRVSEITTPGRFRPPRCWTYDWLITRLIFSPSDGSPAVTLAPFFSGFHQGQPAADGAVEDGRSHFGLADHHLESSLPQTW